MKLSLKSVNSKVDSFLKESLKIKSSKLRLSIIIALYLAAIIGLFGVLPFIIGIYLVLLVLDKIEHNSTKIAVSAIVFIFTLLIGIPWASATYAPSNSQIKSEVTSATSVAPTQTSTQTATLTPEPTKTETATPEATKTREKTVTPKTPVAVKTATPKPISTPAAQSTPASSPNGSGYTNVDGNHINSPNNNPAGATAKCRDGNYSYSQHRQGTCSGHGGVANWL